MWGIKRRKKKKVSKLLLAWKSVVVLSMILNLVLLKTTMDENFGKKPAVRRFALLVFADGIKYRVNKYWNISI